MNLIKNQMLCACIRRSKTLSSNILFADVPTRTLNQSASKEALRAFFKINETRMTILILAQDSRMAAKSRRMLYTPLEEIRGELNTGTYSEDENASRQQKTVDWLKMMGR